MLLVWTCKGDRTADWFIEKFLRPSRKLWLRLDTDDTENVFSFLLGRSLGSLRTGLIGRFDAQDVEAVWYRRQFAPTLLETADDLRPYVQGEIQAALDNLQNAIQEATWVNWPEHNRSASRKAEQLRSTKSVGFRIPETLITNSPCEAASFARLMNGMVIVKPLRRGTLQLKAGIRILYSNIITLEQIQQHEHSIRLAPLIFQEVISKDYEVRLIVIGGRCFGVKLDSQEFDETRVDWRRDALSIKHEVIKLPQAVADGCLAIARMHELKFTAFDFVVDRGEFVFLEYNSNGQFAWLEEMTGVQLGKQLLETLLPT